MKITGAITSEELAAYEEHARRTRPNMRLVGINIEGEYATLEYEPIPFERIRRITGYLAPVKSWNGAKRAELADRVKHGGGKQ